MKIRLTRTGATMDRPDSYARRMVEQGQATPAQGAKEATEPHPARKKANPKSRRKEDAACP